MRSYLEFFTFTVVVVIFSLSVLSCGSISPFLSSATTQLQSSTLISARALGVTSSGTLTAQGWAIDPTDLSGKVSSVFFVTSTSTLSENSEGIVVYGFYRPDIATPLDVQHEFTLSTPTVLSGMISRPPWYVGGGSEVIMMSFGYFDVEFQLPDVTSPETYTVRFWYGDEAASGEASAETYARKGDIQILDEDGSYKWLDTSTATSLSAGTLVTTRPASPRKNSFIAEFVSESHPDEQIFPLAATFTPAIDIRANVIDNYDLEFIVDSDLQNSLLFLNTSSAAEVAALEGDRAGILAVVDMTQNYTNWYEVDGTSGLTCTVTMNMTPK